MTPSPPSAPRSAQSGDESPHSTRAARLSWLDLFRGACVVGMIETHVLNTFLAAPARATTWFHWLTYFDGLIAPAFLFIAGYAQGLGVRSASAEPRPIGKKLRRLGTIWLLGYVLHFPAPQILAGQWSEALRLGTIVDVLQCLAVSLAVLLAAERWARRWIDVLAKVLVVLAVIFTGLAAHWRFEPAWLLGYFNSSTGSLFPLLPWAGFVFAGFLASSITRWLSWEVGVNLALIVTAALLFDGEVAFFAERLAWLLAAVPLVQWIGAHWQPPWLLYCGRESLVLYAAHLVLIETLAVTALPRAGFSPAACVAIFAGVLIASVVIAWVWRRRDTSLRPVRSGAHPHS